MTLLDDIQRRVRENRKEKEVKRQQQEEQKEIERQRQEERKTASSEKDEYVLVKGIYGWTWTTQSDIDADTPMTEPENPTVTIKKESVAITEPVDPIASTKKRSFEDTVALARRLLIEKERKQAAPSFPKKDWVKLSFSLPDRGSLGFVFKKLYLTSRYFAYQIETVIAGSQAETAGVVAGDVVMDESEKVFVMAESQEILKWNEGPLCFSVLRKRCTCTNQKKLAR
jgi:hypothetical protein